MTTLLKKEQVLQNLNSVVHEGKVVVFATDVDSKIWYTIKQDGFEDSYLNTPADQRTGWENWQLLEFPNENDDQSVVNQEKDNLTYQSDGNKFILKSRYKTITESATAPVQVISALGHVYVFRQSKTNTLLVDRFVLDGMTNKLNRKLEVRFKRSKQRLTPIKSMKKSAGALTNVDSLDFRDANGNFFYEPTTEVCAVSNLSKGWFSVVLVPTIENDIYRWHIFAYNSQTQKVELTTIRASSEGLFDVKDYTIFEPVDDGLSPRKIPGLIKRTLDINGVAVTNGLSATKYDLQQAQQTQSGEEQLLKTATRLMLAIPTDKGTAAFSFGIAGDGTLAEIDDTPDSTVLRSRQREILLPLNTLDEVKAFADRTPPPQGIIRGLAVGTDEEDAEDLVKIATDAQAADLENGDMVKITGTSDYQGLYRSRKIDENTFEIDVPSSGELGYWEKEEPEASGLVFDGMISAYAKTADGKLQVTCEGHGLENGDEVQIVGTDAYNNSYPVQKVDDTHFVIDRKWATGEAVNVKLVSRRRRGIVFDGVEDYIALDELAYDFNQGITVEAWVYYDSFKSWSRVVDLGNGSGVDNIILANDGVTNNLALHIYRGNLNQYITAVGVLEVGKWIHVAATIDKSGNATLYKNGAVVQQGKVHLPNQVKRTRNYVGRSIAIFR
ncbi:MAG: LamG domain-containing protein [Pseudanabaena sp. ELA607]